MLRDLKISRRNSGKIPSSEVNQENIPAEPSDLSNAQPDLNPSRPPFIAIQEQFSVSRQKMERTPTKSYSRGLITTPRAYKTIGKASSVQSDASSTHSTPTKSVTKPRNYYTAFSSSRRPLGTLPRPMSLPAHQTVVNAVEVPRFELREDPSFWMDHNVQVVIRVRPLNDMEISLYGHNRCLKQDTAQSIVWIGQPESRFIFDHVACETIDQEMLFRVAGLPMVENCLSGYNSCMFAYGQTGSGKTYTMLGEVDELEYKPTPQLGMTPRIFEYLFARIRAEEESRKDEKLKYSCRCSFLEIYNEQITDLLQPSSTNLLLREDLRKGVYVENLMECEVDSVNDILKLLIQGAANRKVAATNMNRESSRSHSVFTCVIESTWEKDSSTNMRFARLNLVDLAGSERQKASGAEGERLKEAANINKSLSTLGHVIMILSDVSHAKQRHVPYRDSRLTFLLQDSLGGNSKTMIIANVSPSICCANETLSTLKFAQRAKLIQNNAVVNEDTSGDVIALQHQIRILKEELSVLRRQNVTRSLSFPSATLEESENNSINTYAAAPERMDFDQANNLEASHSVRISIEQLKSLETILYGALRREKMAEGTVKLLQAEIKQLNLLVNQREEDSRCSKMMLKFREDKIKRMESLIDGIMPKESYLLEEINVLTEEVQLLQARVDPEMLRFASENIRLSNQLMRFQDFYEDGGRESLREEVSQLRDQLIQVLEGKSELVQHPDPDTENRGMGNPDFMSSTRDSCFLRKELNKTCMELEACRNNLESFQDINEKLKRELTDVQIELKNAKSLSYGSENLKLEHGEHVHRTCKDISGKIRNCASNFATNHAEEILKLELELDILKEILKEERSARLEAEEKAFHFNDEEVANKSCLQSMPQHENLMNELKDAKIAFEALESQNVHIINELQWQKASNSQFVELVTKQKEEISFLKKKLGLNVDAESKLNFSQEMVGNQSPKLNKKEDSPLQKKLRKMQASLEKAKLLNMRHHVDRASYRSNEREMEEVREQVEEETAQVIMSLQEELIRLQQLVDDSNRDELLAKETLTTLQTEMKELNERLCLLTHDNERLSDLVDSKERDLKTLNEDWEKLASDIAEILEDGNNALLHASDQVNHISSYFPQRKWICHSFEMVTRSMSEKDLLIDQLQRHLEDVQNAKSDMEWKLRSIRGATVAITEAQQQESSDKEKQILDLMSELCTKKSIITELEERVRQCDHQGCLQSDIENQSYDRKAKLELCLSHDVQSDAKEQDHAQTTSDLCVSKEDDEGFSSIVDSVHKLKVGIATLHYSLSEFSCQVGLIEVCSLGKYSIKSSHEDYMKRLCSEETGDFTENEGSNNNILLIHGQEKPSNKGFEGKFSFPSSRKTNGIALLKVELELALDSLKSVQEQMNKLIEEKKWIQKSEIQSRPELEHLAAEVVRLKLDIDKRESHFSSRLQEVQHKLLRLEENAIGTTDYWRKAKEALELEVNDVKAVAAQKTVETSSLLAKFEEAQETMEEADIMVNALLEAKESANDEIERLQKVETMLTYERNYLRSQLQLMEKEHHKTLSEVTVVVLELEKAFNNLRSTFQNDLVLLNDEVCQLKIQVQTYTDSARSWLEETWSDIIGKDCTVSVLYLCQMGILLERITELKSCENLTSENLSLRSELMRKDEVEKGLLFDMSLLQESVSIIKDQRDELHSMNAVLRSLKDEIASKSCELDKALAEKEVVKAQLIEKSEIISALQLENTKKHGMLCQVSTESLELKAQKHEILQLKHAIDEELIGKGNLAETLEEELCETSTLLEEKTRELEALQHDFSNLLHDRDQLNSQIFALKEQLDIAHALAEENEAIAVEARQIAEGRKAYAEDKDEEVKLLEKSVEELEHTVGALENKVEIIKEEAERQKFQREQLEKELEIMRYQFLTLPTSAGNADISRLLEEKMKELQEAQKNVTLLQKEAADKNAEIAQCKSYISELNMHADAQAREYKKKFKELEVMAQQMKADRTSGASCQASLKSEKATKPRGSGSPFKCIGLGLTQQINSEKDEDLSAARCRIEDLEALVATRQKEILMLNARLAAAENMTHDVIRDLLGVKLDMTNYVTLLDKNQVERADEDASSSCKDCHDKELVVKLRKQLHELIQDRQSLLDEVYRKQTELMAAQTKVEKLRQREQLLTTENNMLKMENAKHNKMVMELEDEISKLTSQQNLQLRIHHHAKIKEENNLLKAESEELHAKLMRLEAVLSRVREELAWRRAQNGKTPYIDFDNEEQLQKKLDEAEEEREQLAQTLMNLCAKILKVAGLTQYATNMSATVAEDALNQLKCRFNSLETELVDLKLKCKIYCEKIRLFELEEHTSPLCLGVGDSCSSASISSTST